MASNTGKRARNRKKGGATGASTSGGELGRNGGSNVASDDNLQRAGSRSKCCSDPDVFVRSDGLFVHAAAGSVNSRTTTNGPTASSTARTPSPDEELQSNISSLSKNPPAPRSSASSQSPSQSDGGGSDASTPVTSTQGQDDNKDDGDSWSRFGIDEEDEEEDEAEFGVPTATNVVVMRAVVDEGATPMMNNGWEDMQSADESPAAPSNTAKQDDPWGDTPTKTVKGTTTATTTIPAIWPSRDRTTILNPGAPTYKPWTAPYASSSPKDSPPLPSSIYNGPTPTKNSWNTQKKVGPVKQEGADWKSGPRKVWDTGSAVGRSLVNGNANSNGDENDGWGHVSKGPWDDPDPVPSGGQGRSKGVGGWNAPVASGGSKQRVDDGRGAGSSSSGGSGGGGWKTQARVGGGNGGSNGGGGKGKKSKEKGQGGNGGGGGGGSSGNAPGGGRNVPGSSGWSNPNNNSNNAPKPKGWQDNVSVGPW